jgi:tRNA threonylcarbamoyladenosine biosynthesis protein TsaB
VKILAADTTSATGGVALSEEGVIRALVDLAKPYAHAQSLLPVIDRLLGEAGLSLASLDGLAVAAGPGSFTGLRIGIATMEGLAFASGRPVVGVSVLEALAHRYRDRSPRLAALIDARRGEVFAALYRREGGEWRCEIGPLCEAPATFLSRIDAGPLLVAGSAVAAYRDLIRERLGPMVDLAEGPSHLAEEVALLGEREIRQGRLPPLGGIRAIYIRPSDAERGREAKEARTALRTPGQS